jgi:undecaprenyl-diphosphatase
MLNDWDTQLFLLLNGMHSPWLDAAMWWISEKTSWIPLYLGLSGYLFFRFRWRAVWILAGTAVLVAIADQSSVWLFKEVFQRIRPCLQPEIADRVHLVNDYCGGRFGFISSHACNHFAVAVFTALWIRRRWYWSGILLWAGVVSYSRIYLGVHFPGDVLGGAVVGSLLAWAAYAFMVRREVLGPGGTEDKPSGRNIAVGHSR